MSLRSEIHAAMEVITPSMGGMPERVVDAVLAEEPARRRRHRMLFRMRAPLSLVAAIVAIALVVAVLVGGRLVVDWNAAHKPSPAGGDYQSTLAQLESRPMHLPAVSPTGSCSSGPVNADNSYWPGPVYGASGPVTSSSWGFYYHNLAFAKVKVGGPVLIRARDVLTGRAVVFVGTYAAGPVLGTDTIDGKLVQQRGELVIDTHTTSADLGEWWASLTRHGFDWPYTAGVPRSWSGSTGWQIDAPGFSEVFMAC